MWRPTAILITWNLLHLCVSCQQLTAPIVNIPGMGVVQGSIDYTAWTNRTIYQFQGIPYAEAPVGALRFKPAVKRAPWIGILDASQPGNRCPQITEELGLELNEDCLTLSIFSNDISEVRPVLVWIHEGYFSIGGLSWFPPNFLLEADIVLVIIQYRLGPLGFLSLLNDQIPGNVGILDTIMAIEWVQQYIGHFGGNPMEVTVNGASSGAVMASALLHSPLVKNRPVPLFQRMILQSGSVFSSFAICNAPVEGSLDIARRVGCTDEATIEECLQQVPAIRLIKAALVQLREDNRLGIFPRLSGACIAVGGPSGLFPEHPNSYLDSAPNDVPLMVGIVGQDGLFLLDLLFKLKPELLFRLQSEVFPLTGYDLLQFLRLLQETFGHTKLDGALEVYQIKEYFFNIDIDQPQWKDVVPGIIDICSNYALKGPALLDVHAVSAVNPKNVFLFNFDFSNDRPQPNRSFPFPYTDDVDHNEDVFYLFPRYQLSERETKMAKTMVQLWGSFISSGVPRAENVPCWRPVNRLYGPYLRIDEVIEQRNCILQEFRASAVKFGRQKKLEPRKFVII